MNYKKFVFIISFLAVFGCFLGINIPDANAATAAEIQALITQLQARIVELQKELAKVQPEQAVWCHNFNRDLKYGNAGEEVRALQTALEKQGFYNRTITGSFDEFTASAVVGFQEKYKKEILSPWGLEHGTGYVGSTTRKKLNELYGCGVVSPKCQMLWWYDNNHQYCQQKQFCGAYMYLGLRTFSTKEKCEASLNPEKSITVISPNGGETWDVGNTYDIKWEAKGLKTYLRTWVMIAVISVNHLLMTLHWTRKRRETMTMQKIRINLLNLQICISLTTITLK